MMQVSQHKDTQYGQSTKYPQTKWLGLLGPGHLFIKTVVVE